MTRTRWKLAAGALAASFGGLAAVSDIPACNGKDAPAPITIPQAGPSALPPAPAPLILTAADLPATIPPVPAVGTVVGATAEVAPMPRPAADAKATVTELTLPILAEPVAAAAVPVAPVVAAEAVPPAPAPTPVSGQVAPIVPMVSSTSTPVAAVTPAPQPAAPVPQPVAPVSQPVATVPEKPAPAAEPPALAPAAGEKRLKVMLHMGEDRPWFEVRDGNEVYLKVVCDTVDVKSPAQRGDSPSVMRASGKVFFVTPGGEGLCEELTVSPGTGQVAVGGKVAFTYNWGKTETTVSGDKMTFRLGTAPGAAPGVSAGTVPASYQRPVR